MSLDPTAAGTIGPLVARVAAVCDRFLPLLPPGPALESLKSIQAGLAEPLRVAVTGRVNAGKSTLVNALLGQRVAPTDVSECTRYVTWYRYGVPERVEVLRRNGSRERRALLADGSMPHELGVAEVDVQHLEVYLGNEVLRSMTVIDTPGLGSGSRRSDDTGELLALDVRSRLAVAQADAVLFALTAQAVASEQNALDAFRSMTSGTSTTALNAIGVLSRADQLDAEEPLTKARDVAESITRTGEGSLAAVVSIVGLLAEATACGLLTEDIANALAQLADLDDSELGRLLLSTDRFAGAEIGIPYALRQKLLEHLDLFGIEEAIGLVRAGARTATNLVDELRQLSGFDQLLALLARTFAANGDALKAAAALSALERLAYSGMGAGPMRQDLLDALEAVQLDPAMHRLAELRAWLVCERGETDLSAELRSEVTAMTAAGSPPARLGLAEDASRTDTEDAALGGMARWKSISNDPSASGSTRAVADVMVRSLEQLWNDLRGSQG